jgi:uncharacterized protein YcfJ
MNKLPTFLDIKNQKRSMIFESEQIQDLTQSQINEAEKAYYDILEKIKNGEDLDEGFLGALIGGGIGAVAGPAIGKAICAALGISETGVLGKLLTSRLVTTSIGIALGK